MKFPSALAAGLICATCLPASADVLISQYYEGSSNNKWIELTNTDATPVSLNGFVLTSWNNAATENWKSGGGSPNNSESLDGLSIPANGFLLIANDEAVLPAYAVGDLSSTTTFVNGDDSVVLYNTALGIVGDTAAIADALGFTDAGAEGSNRSFYRLGNGPGFDLSFGSTVLDFPAVWGEKTNTEVDDAVPADAWYLHNFAANASDELTVTLSTNTIAENGGAGLVDVTVTRTGSTAAVLDVVISSNDESEATVSAPNQTIAAGQASATYVMLIDAVDDAFTDGTKLVTITAAAAGFTSGSAELSVTDDGDVQDIVINEIHADPAAGSAGDANADGTTSSGEDEFIEIINLSGADLDISNWEIHDGANPQAGTNPRHAFTAGTILKAGCAIVVFGGGLTDGLGGTAQYQIAQSLSLSLNNGGDIVTIIDSGGTSVAEVEYGAEGGNNQSLTRDPDITGSFVAHSTAAGGGGALYSPGNLLDGSLICPGAGDLSVSFSAPSMNENGGSLTATIGRTGAMVGDLDVLIRLDDESEALADIIANMVTIPDGQPSVEITINAVDDVAPDGTQTVTVTAIANDYATGRGSFDVEDDGDGVFDAFVFNEVLSDPPPGSDPNKDGNADTSEDEFVELVNVSGDVFDLSGFELFDGFGQRHVFPPGTVVGDGQAIVVFGGGSPNGSFGGSVVQVASTGALGLNNGGDEVILAAAGGAELLRFDYDGTVQNESMTRDPDIIGSFTSHSTAAGAGAALFTPGTQVDGMIFSGGVAPGTIRLEFISIDFTTNEITVNVSGLQPVISYSFDVSLDLGLFDPWPSIQNFTIDTGTEVSPGIYQFTFSDSLIPFSEQQFYRVSQP